MTKEMILEINNRRKEEYKRHAVCVFDNGVLCVLHELTDHHNGLNEDELTSFFYRAVNDGLIEQLRGCMRYLPTLIAVLEEFPIEEEERLEKEHPELFHVNCGCNLNDFFLPF